MNVSLLPNLPNIHYNIKSTVDITLNQKRNSRYHPLQAPNVLKILKILFRVL